MCFVPKQRADDAGVFVCVFLTSQKRSDPVNQNLTPNLSVFYILAGSPLNLKLQLTSFPKVANSSFNIL